MTDIHLTTLQQEWTTLQNQFDSYEKLSLIIKLANIIITSVLLFGLNAGYWAILICAVLWLQDGIWKAFQSRMAQRIDIVEQAIKESFTAKTSEKPMVLGMQFNTAWSELRPGVGGLIAEYVKQSLKPTVAYPHVILLIIIVAKMLA